MATALQNLIDAYIKRNANQEITGPVLNGVLTAIANALGTPFVGSDGYWYTYDAESGQFVKTDTPAQGETGPVGVTEAAATIDDQIGTPSVAVSLNGTRLDFAFRNLKGQKGDTGDAGITAAVVTVDSGIGTPSVDASITGTTLTLAFHNLKGETGSAAGFGTIEATVDDTTGTPAVVVTESGPDTAKNLSFAFSGLKGPKGDQGDTGVSADYPITIANNLTTDDPTAALAASQGVVLKGEIDQLGQEVDGIVLNATETPSASPAVNNSLINVNIPSGSSFIVKITFSGVWTRFILSYNGTSDNRLLDVTSTGNNGKELTFVAPTDITTLGYYLTYLSAGVLNIEVIAKKGLERELEEKADSEALMLGMAEISEMKGEMFGGEALSPLNLNESSLWSYGYISSVGTIVPATNIIITKPIKSPKGKVSIEMAEGASMYYAAYLYNNSGEYLGDTNLSRLPEMLDFDSLVSNYANAARIVLLLRYADASEIPSLSAILGDVIFSSGATFVDDFPGTAAIVGIEANHGINIFDAADPDVLIGHYINNGSEGFSASYNTSGYIPVSPNTTYYKATNSSDFRFVNYYNTDRKYLSSEAQQTGNFTTPANCAYVRVTFFASSYDTAQVSLESVAYSPYIRTLELTGQMGIDDNSLATKKYVDDAVSGIIAQNNDILRGKKWAVFGDSFTDGATASTLPDGQYQGKRKVYQYFIGNRTGINVLPTFFASGRTLAYPAVPGGFINSATCPGQAYFYQNVPVDVDYITIYLGINDSHHAPSSGGGDGEDNTGVIPLGAITDNTTDTYYGAWNVVLSWLIENRPNAHIGIIISNGCDTPDYRTAQIAIAKKYGIPYLDLNGDERCPFMIRSQNTEIDATIRLKRTMLQSVDYPNNQHPNDDAHLFESYFIESWLRTI